MIHGHMSAEPNATSSAMANPAIGELPGNRFAVIVDEAHSSQSGESTKSLKAVLASGSLEEAEAEEREAETPEEELENIILAEMEKRLDDLRGHL